MWHWRRAGPPGAAEGAARSVHTNGGIAATADLLDALVRHVAQLHGPPSYILDRSRITSRRCFVASSPGTPNCLKSDRTACPLSHSRQISTERGKMASTAAVHRSRTWPLGKAPTQRGLHDSQSNYNVALSYFKTLRFQPVVTARRRMPGSQARGQQPRQSCLDALGIGPCAREIDATHQRESLAHSLLNFPEPLSRCAATPLSSRSAPRGFESERLGNLRIAADRSRFPGSPRQLRYGDARWCRGL